MSAADRAAAGVEPPAESCEPRDEADRALLAQVRPPGWVNPRVRERYDLAVIGAGTGGLVSAAIAAALGARVALVERHRMGGDCLNTGCVPSKALLRTARAWHEARTAAERFGGPAAAGDGDFAAALARMRRLRAELSPADGAHRFRAMGVDVFFAEARFAAPDVLEWDGARLSFRRAIVAAGARPAVPPVPGLASAGFLTSETVFSLSERPERLVVIGAGPVGCELAQAFARLGSRVALLECAASILPHDDADAAEVVRAALAREGIDIHTGAVLDRVEGEGERAVVHFAVGAGRRRTARGRVLVAAGRAPNIEALRLELAGIAVGEHGIRVDARLRTTNRRVYAVGDVCSRLRFTHAADAQARIAVRNALFYGRARFDERLVPRCTYTDPELAHVGITAREAAERRAEVQTLTVAFVEIDRARLDDAADGFLRLHLARRGGRILGATVVGEHAGELVAQIAQAMTAGLGLAALGEAVFPYPTRAEALRRAADQWRRGRLTPRVRTAFERYFRLTRGPARDERDRRHR